MDSLMTGFNDELEKLASIKSKLLEAGLGSGAGAITGVLSAKPAEGESRIIKGIKRGVLGAGLGLLGGSVGRRVVRHGIRNKMLENALKAKQALRVIRDEARLARAVKTNPPSRWKFLSRRRPNKAADASLRKSFVEKQQLRRDYNQAQSRLNSQFRQVDDRVFGVL